MSYISTVPSPTNYRQPLPTVNCPYCTLLLEYPPDAHIIRCPVCSGTSMLQVMQQLHMPCRRCHTLLSYFAHYALLQCPHCHLQQPPLPSSSVYTAHAAPQPSPTSIHQHSHTVQQQQRRPQNTVSGSNIYPGTYAVMPSSSPRTNEARPNIQSPAARSGPPNQQSYQPPLQRFEAAPSVQPTTPVASAPRLSVDTKPRSKSATSIHAAPSPAPTSASAAALSSASSSSSALAPVSVSASSASSTVPSVTNPSVSSSSKRKSPKLSQLLAGIHITAPPPAGPTRASLSALSERQHSSSSSIDLNQITPVVGDYSAFSSADDDGKRNPPTVGASSTPSSASALGRLSGVVGGGGRAGSDGNGRFVALPEESTVEYSRWDGEPSVYRREDEDESGEVEAADGDNAGGGSGAVFRGRQGVYSPSSLSRQQSASVYHND